jgi:hypothetical protein
MQPDGERESSSSRRRRRRIGVDPTVAEKWPVRAHLVDSIQVAGHDQRLFAIAGSTGEHAAEGIGDGRATPEREIAFAADAVDRGHGHAVGDRVRALCEPQPDTKTGDAYCRSQPNLRLRRIAEHAPFIDARVTLRSGSRRTTGAEEKARRPEMLINLVYMSYQQDATVRGIPCREYACSRAFVHSERPAIVAVRALLRDRTTCSIVGKALWYWRSSPRSASADA